MRGKLFVILAIIFCRGITGCQTEQAMNDISQVSYTSDSGTILPELQWHEQIIITKNKVSLTRNGRAADTKVNTGVWEFVVDEPKVTALFAQLTAVNRAAIKRVEPDDPPDGGGTESYTIIYAGDQEFSLVYDPGTTYTNGGLIVEPVEAFIQSLTLPAEAASRYNFSSP